MWLHCMCAEMIDTNYAPSFKNFIIQRRHLNHYWLMISKLEVSLSRLVFISSKQRSSLSSSLHSFTLVLELKLLLLHDWCCFNHIIMVFDFAAISHQSLLQIVVSHHRITFHVQISTDSIRSDPTVTCLMLPSTSFPKSESLYIYLRLVMVPHGRRLRDICLIIVQ